MTVSKINDNGIMLCFFSGSPVVQSDTPCTLAPSLGAGFLEALLGGTVKFDGHG